MASHGFKYPPQLANCKLCGSERFHMNTQLGKNIETDDIACIFSIQCDECGYETKTYTRPDVACNAWNIAGKVMVNDLLISVTGNSRTHG